MLLGLDPVFLSGTNKGEVRYSLGQNNAPVLTSSTTWIEWSPVIGSMREENLESCFAAFRSTRTLMDAAESDRWILKIDDFNSNEHFRCDAGRRGRCPFWALDVLASERNDGHSITFGLFVSHHRKHQNQMY
jgi:hypothetical protein